MPDIDMDFDSRYRDEMIRYAAERYGRDHVAQIITFGTIKARNAVRDAARVLGFPYGVGDRIAKAMPPLVMGRDTPLKYCFEQHPKYVDGYKAASELRAMYDTDTDVKKVVDVAKGLEGLKRSDGIHAAAVVITKEPLTDYLPVQRKPESGQDPENAPVVTQYEMHGVEELGLLKMDFLGLRNLDVITDTVEMVRAGARSRLRHRRHRPRRPADAGTAPARRRHRRVPAGGRPAAGADEVAEADELRRRRRPRRPLPARADGGEHAQRLRRPQERAQADRVPAPRPRGAARRHLRADDLPGVGDAGGPEDRRLLARRGRPAAQGDGQEVARGHRHRAGQVHRRRRAHRLRARPRHPPVRHHRAVRRLRLQQEPRLRLRPRRLPDGLPQGAPPRRVLRLPADQRQEQPGEGGGVHRRVPGDGHPRAHAGRQPVAHGLRRAGARPTFPRASACRWAARAPSRSASPPCATSGPGWSSCCSPSATPTGRSPASTTSPPASPSRCSTSGPSSR